MPHPADLVLDANYRGPFAADAEYFAPGIPLVAGQGLACRVMRGGQQAGLDIGGMNVRPLADTDTLKVRVREVPQPLRGGAFHLREERAFYRLMAEAECFDRHRREWTCETLKLADIVIPPPFAAVTGRGVSGGLLRAVAIDAAAIGTGRAGAISLVQEINAPATGRGRAFAALELAGSIEINAPATGTGIAGGVLRAVSIDAAGQGAGVSGGARRAIFIDAPASGTGRAFAGIDAQGNIEIDAPGTGRGRAFGVIRSGQLDATAMGRGVSGTVARRAWLAGAATGTGVSGDLARASQIDAAASGRGVAGAALELDGSIEINAPATGRGVAGDVLRASAIDAAATGAGVSGGVVRDGALDAPATGTAIAGAPVRQAWISGAASGTGVSSGLVRAVTLEAPATGAGVAAGALQRQGNVNSAATGAGASGGVQRGAAVGSPASGAGVSGAVVRGGQVNAPATGTGVAGTVVGEEAGGPAFDAFTIHAWDPDAGSNASGIVPDAIGSRSLHVRRGASAVANWDGQCDDHQLLILDAADAAACVAQSARSLTFWMRRDATAEDYTEICNYALDYPGGAGPQGQWTLSYGTGGFIQHTIRTGFDFGAGGNIDTFTDDTWVMWTLTFGANQWRAYLNTTQFVDNTFDNLAPADITAVLRFGGGEPGPQDDHTDTFPTDTNLFVGRYGDIRVHNKILSPAEISALVAAGRQSY